MTFFFTFGQKYRHEAHPRGGHPDGWFEVEAPSAAEARERMFRLCGPLWSHQYTNETFSRDLFPRGCLQKL
jgi:hypothetical protein